MSTAATARPTRVAMIALHTSPLERPGTGDAGGLNVYVAETAVRLARRGVQVDVFTRTTPRGSGTLTPSPGVTVHHLPAGPPDADKGELPQHVGEFADALLARAPEPYDVIHSHYWLSGVVGRLVRERLGRVGMPAALAHTMHTMARVKNSSLADGESPEPPVREEGEALIVRDADALVANTQEEARALIDLYDADPARVRIVHPGVATETFRPGDRAADRAELGLAPDAAVLLFVGRLQPLKAPDVLVRAAGELIRRDPALRERLVVAILGGLSGSGLHRPDSLARLIEAEGIGDLVHRESTMSRDELARWYRAADLLTVPSHHESFGLVAVEALASGTPVIAAHVGGLPVAVGEVGVLVEGHDPADWADAIQAALHRLDEPGERAAWSQRAVEHAAAFSWESTVDGLLDAYAEAIEHADQTRTRVS
ncbi:D-inositol-3-phosphate glycosyltransferase [Ornithinimicrobium sp. Y1847]|uniref:D-inositol-3-phosphate glycosyltransferase n=1 Tax=Ornithinimicrobium sp. Y1847 TaxID=3405419 RepID=UPI003B670254